MVSRADVMRQLRKELPQLEFTVESGREHFQDRFTVYKPLHIPRCYLAVSALYDVKITIQASGNNPKRHFKKIASAVRYLDSFFYGEG